MRMPRSDIHTVQETIGSADVAALLREIGQRIELSGDGPFKARAYFRAAESLLVLTEPHSSRQAASAIFPASAPRLPRRSKRCIEPARIARLSACAQRLRLRRWRSLPCPA